MCYKEFLVYTECFHIYALPSSSNNDNLYKAKKDKYLNCFKVSSLAHRSCLNFCSHQIYAKFSNCEYSFFKMYGFVAIELYSKVYDGGKKRSFLTASMCFRLPFIFLSVQ